MNFHDHKLFPLLPGFLVLLFLLPAKLQAQSEFTDSVYIETVDPEEEGDEDEPVYFLEKSVYERAPDSVYPRRLRDSTLDALREDDAFWYANASFKRKEAIEKKEGSFEWLRSLTWILLVAGFIALVVWFLVSSDVGVFRRSKKTRIASPETIDEATNIFNINYEQEIAKAIGAKDFRFAVRLLFLQLLARLSEKNRITYAPEKTNLDYLFQLQSSSLYKDFFRITRNYEYTWYGKFDLGLEAFEAIGNDFETINRRLG